MVVYQHLEELSCKTKPGFQKLPSVYLASTVPEDEQMTTPLALQPSKDHKM